MNTRWGAVIVIARRLRCATVFALGLGVSLLLSAGVMPLHAADGNDPPPLFLPLILGNEGAAPGPTVWINEFMADNDGVVADEHGEYDDVIELYNPGLAAVDLGGMYLTDDLAEPLDSASPMESRSPPAAICSSGRTGPNSGDAAYRLLPVQGWREYRPVRHSGKRECAGGQLHLWATDDRCVRGALSGRRPKLDVLLVTDHGSDQ